MALATLLPATMAAAQSTDFTKDEVESKITGYVAMSALYMAKNLKDPASAMFQDVYVVKIGTSIIICGEVNSKNSYGGYSGFAAFKFTPLPSNDGDVHGDLHIDPTGWRSGLALCTAGLATPAHAMRADDAMRTYYAQALARYNLKAQ